MPRADGETRREPVRLAFTRLKGPAGVTRCPLVVLHGLFGSRSNWRTLGRRLAQHRDVYLLDAVNHGLSPRAETMGYREQSADLLAFLEAERLPQPVLIGHSMGGKTAMLGALRAPDRVAGLVVVDIAPVPYPATGNGAGAHADLIGAMKRLPLRTLTSRRMADRTLAGTVEDPSLRAFLLHSLVRAPDGSFEWQLNLRVLTSALPELRDFPLDELEPTHGGARFEGTTLFLLGGSSEYVRPNGRSTARALFPRAHFEVIPGAGHWLHAERPEETYARVARALEAVYAGTDGQ